VEYSSFSSREEGAVPLAVVVVCWYWCSHREKTQNLNLCFFWALGAGEELLPLFLLLLGKYSS
jgi:hypothetical protein